MNFVAANQEEFRMTTTAPTAGLQLRSLVKPSGELELSLQSVTLSPPRQDEVVVRIEASPINPSDIGLLFGAADMNSARLSGTPAEPILSAPIAEVAMGSMAGRLNASLPVGNEGAGVVVAAGKSAEAQALLGKSVAVLGGAMYAQYRALPADQCLVLPPYATPAEGASCFVNPLTALGMLETMRREGHTALVHTAAASNLGQMLNRICQRDGIALVNIVRKPDQVAVLKSIGAQYVCDSSSASFMQDLTKALIATGATLAFDATGGGKLAGQILGCMEASVKQDRQRVQPLRIHHAQAGLSLWRSRHAPHRVRPQLRHGLGHGRLAAVPVPSKDRSSGCAQAEAARRRRAQDDLRQPLRRRTVAGRSLAAGMDCCVWTTGHRCEVPDQSEQALT
jgi:NADPH2:quinone reductase